MSEDAAKEQQRQIQRIRDAQTHYEVLGLQFNPDAPDTAPEEVEKQYRQLARRLHPDKCSLEGAEEAFKSINLAQSTLLDPEKKTRNDQLVRLNGRFRGDLDSNFELHQASEDVGDFFREKPEGGYCGALMRFAVIIGTIILAFSRARLQVELPAVRKLEWAATPLAMVVGVVLFGWLFGFTWWEILKWAISLYYGWTAAHLVPWQQVVTWQTKNAYTLMGVPIWAGILIAFITRVGFKFDLLASLYIGVCEIFLLGLTCLRHSSPLPMLGLGSGFLVLVAIADVDGALAATVAVFIFFCGSKDGGVIVYASLIFTLLYLAFRITPLLCVGLLFACAVRSQDVELTSMLSGLIALISLFSFGLYWLVFFAIEGVVCKWAFGYLWEGRGWGHKRVGAAILMFALFHGIADSSFVAAILLAVGLVGVVTGFEKLVAYENERNRDPAQETWRDAEAVKQEKKEAKKTAKKEAKKEAKKGKKR